MHQPDEAPQSVDISRSSASQSVGALVLFLRPVGPKVQQVIARTVAEADAQNQPPSEETEKLLDHFMGEVPRRVQGIDAESSAL